MSNWYLQTGKDSDVVISTRARLARNIDGYSFPNHYKSEEAKQILEKIQEIAPSLGYGLKCLKLKDMDDLTKLTLVEKHIISPDFIGSKNEYAAILINEEENICIMINEEDHMRLQVFNTGLDIENVMNLIIELDEKIEKLLPYSYNEKYGYLTADPTNVGTAARVSVMVHLPALAMTENIKRVLQVVNGFGMNIRGIYGEGTESHGNFYQISNNQTLGLSEKEIVKNMKVVTEKLIEQERTARKLLGKNELELANLVYRSYGILTYARKLTSEECRKLLSDVRLGNDMGIITEMGDTKMSMLELYTKPASLQKYVGKQMDTIERDIARAEVVKQIITK